MTILYKGSVAIYNQGFHPVGCSQGLSALPRAGSHPKSSKEQMELGTDPTDSTVLVPLDALRF